MANLLFLVHRLPYPPNKGDKVRSYHLLKHFAKSHRVFLGTFIDDPQDEKYVDTVRALCAELHVCNLHPGIAKLRGLTGLGRAQPLSLGYYRDARMAGWVRGIRAREKMEACVVFSSAMAQYASLGEDATAETLLVDFVDADSAKWTQYASRHRWPMSWIYAREGRQLLAYETRIALRAMQSFFVTDNETELFLRLAPQCRGRVRTLCNGVDAEFFSPAPSHVSPYDPAHRAIVFTGAMDYWPNVDAATWFVRDILPQVRKRNPDVRFYIVGRNPASTVTALASDAVVVTGTVEDVRPYLQNAAVVVAPMRVARGVQNKVLEAMAMARPVVAAASCVEAITATKGTEIMAAETEGEYCDAVHHLLSHGDHALALGQAGRRCVLRHYSWDAHLSALDTWLSGPTAGGKAMMDTFNP